MLRVALTGGIASGKTSVSDLFHALDVPVIDTDLIARELVTPGQPALEQIVRHFGPGILHSDGRLDRGQLRRRIFGSPAQRRVLEEILHPAIRREAASRMERLEAPYAIVVIPLLAESHADWGQDRVLLVDAPEELQIERLMRRDHCTRSEAEAALAAQASREQRRSIADDIILNTGSREQLEQIVNSLHQSYLTMGQANPAN